MIRTKLYSYKKCSTCIKAQKFLANQNESVDVVDIVENPPSKKELETMLDCYDGELKKLFNTSGQMYRELGIKDKWPTMKKAEAIRLLSENGKLVKRPFIISGKKGLVGFKEEDWKEFF